MFSFPGNRAEIFDLAAQSQGGGYLGGILLALLQPNFGWEGAAITLAAGTFIALAFSLELSVPEMFGWLAPIATWVGNAWMICSAQVSAKTR